MKIITFIIATTALISTITCTFMQSTVRKLLKNRFLYNYSAYKFFMTSKKN